MEKQFIKGGSTILILYLLNKKSLHGYELIQLIKNNSQGIFSFGEGTIYPMLYSLEDKGLIKGEWESTENSRKKKVYEITTKGKQILELQLQQWTLFKHGMDLALE